MLAEKGAKIAEVWDKTTGAGGWNPIFGRPLNDWELEDVQDFLRLLSYSKINQMEKDKIIWKGDKIGMYYVRANFNILERKTG